MYKILCKSKIQNLKVNKVDSSVHFPVLLNKNLLKRADILDGEKIQVLNLSTGDRVFAYIKASNSDEVVIGEPLSRWIKKDDTIVILSYIFTNSHKNLEYKPKIIDLNKKGKSNGLYKTRR